MKNTKLLIGMLMVFAFASGAFAQLAILSGSPQATQYRFVQDMSNIVGPVLDFKIENQETNGVASNMEMLSDPKSPFKLAIVQGDYLYYMKMMDMRLNTNKTKDLKVVVPLGYQQIHLVTKASRKLKGLEDLRGKIVAIGSAEQGTYRTAMLIKERSDVSWVSQNTNFEDCLRELTLDNIAAFFIVSSAPIEKLDLNPQAMSEKLALVPLADFNDWARYYRPDTIWKSEYKWLDEDIPTFSVPSLLVVNESKLNDKERTDLRTLKTSLGVMYNDLKEKGHSEWKKIDLAGWKEDDWPLFK